MSGKKKGFAFIVNMTFSGDGENLRKGSEVDFTNVIHLFKELGYKIFSHTDLSEDLSVEVKFFCSENKLSPFCY